MERVAFYMTWSASSTWTWPQASPRVVWVGENCYNEFPYSNHSTLGHAHPGLAAAVSKQMLQVHHCSNLYYIPVQAQLAAWLVAHSCADKVFLLR